jgi:hypothetical protein
MKCGSVLETILLRRAPADLFTEIKSVDYS